MRTTSLIVLIFLTLFSCDSSKRQNQQQHKTSKALEDKSFSYEIVSKTRNEDLVEGLYKEPAEKTPDLKRLETQIDKLSDSRNDSLEQFNNYNGKNQSYYQSATSHIEQIEDTVLKERMKLLIQGSLAKYSTLTSKHDDLLNSIDKRRITLSDFHQILKITRTLPIIESYQSNDLPAITPLQGYLNQVNKTIRYADSLTRK